MEVVHGEIRWRHSLEFIPTYFSPPTGIHAFEKIPKIPLAFFSMRTLFPNRAFCILLHEFRLAYV